MTAEAAVGAMAAGAVAAEEGASGARDGSGEASRRRALFLCWPYEGAKSTYLLAIICFG
eukprot:COSAG06_NODE_379_length_16608_cov_83.792477_14_plen_59_part_00